MAFGKFVRSSGFASRTRKMRRRDTQVMIEALEPRTLLSVSIDSIGGLANTITNITNGPATKWVPVPVTATGTTDQLTFTATPVLSSEKGGPTVTSDTTMPQVTAFLQITVAGMGASGGPGVMEFALFGNVAPTTVGRITALASQGAYNGADFYRVISGFMIQGGATTGANDTTMNDEYDSHLLFDATNGGQLAMANSDNQSSSRYSDYNDATNPQFFITNTNSPTDRFLDLTYTIFGQLVRGADVLQRISAVAVQAQSSTNTEVSSPVTPVVMTSVSVVQDPTAGVVFVTGAAGTSATVTVTATDNGTAVATQNFNVAFATDTTVDPPYMLTVNNQTANETITPINTSFNTPVVVPVSTFELQANTVSIAAIEADNGSHATVTVGTQSVSGTDPRITNANLTITPTKGYIGAISVLVGVNESSGRYDTQTFTVNVGAPPTTTVLSAVSPAAAGTSVTFSATASGSNGVLSGTITFYDGSTAISSAAAINVNGVATYTTSTLSVGSHSITAVYSGDSNNATSTSAAQLQLIGALTTTVVTSSTNPIAFGAQATFTATVSAVAGGSPTGTVIFYNGATPISGSLPLNGSKQATFTTTTALSGGSHSITAVYSGDSTTFIPSTSAALSFVVTPTPSTIVTGPDAGSTPMVKVFDSATGTLKFSFLAYNADFIGAVRVASGDFRGNGVSDFVTATGPGGMPLVNVYDGTTGAAISQFYAYVPAYIGGVEIAVANVLGLSTPQIITATDAGGQPLVNIYDYTGKLLGNFFAYSADYIGGVRIAAGDFTGSGKADIVTATATGGVPLVNIFDSSGSLVGNFYAEPLTYTRGFHIAAGDVNGDGIPDIIVGADAGGSADVRVFDGNSKSLLSSFTAYASFAGGVRVAAAYVNGSAKADIITVPGPGGIASVQIFDGLSDQLVSTFNAYATSQLTGAFISAG